LQDEYEKNPDEFPPEHRALLEKEWKNLGKYEDQFEQNIIAEREQSSGKKRGHSAKKLEKENGI
jgi:hypothetical protein